MVIYVRDLFSRVYCISGDGVGAGKSTLAKKMADVTLSLANAIRHDMQKQYPGYDWFNKSQAAKETVVEKTGGLTMRQIMIAYGEGKCKEDPLYFPRHLCEQLYLGRHLVSDIKTIAIDDIRKVCEIEYFRSHFGDRLIHIHVENPSAQREPHFENDTLKRMADYVVRWDRGTKG